MIREEIAKHAYDFTKSYENHPGLNSLNLAKNVTSELAQLKIFGLDAIEEDEEGFLKSEIKSLVTIYPLVYIDYETARSDFEKLYQDILKTIEKTPKNL